MTTRYADHVLTGTTAARPAASAVPAGTLYASSTDGVVYQSSGSAWGTWLAAPAAGIPATLVDVKGDLIAATANDTVARLAVGADGQVLTADSTQTTGIKWAAAGGGGGGALTLLYALTLGSAGTFDQASISGSYNDLIFVLIARGDFSGDGVTPQLRLNNDSAGNYDHQRFYVNGTTFTGAGVAAANNVTIAQTVPAGTSPANHFGNIVGEIPGYASTSWVKEVIAQGAGSWTSGAFYLHSARGIWKSTAAVTRIQVFPSAGNFVAGSQLRIYGRL